MSNRPPSGRGGSRMNDGCAPRCCFPCLTGRAVRPEQGRPLTSPDTRAARQETRACRPVQRPQKSVSGWSFALIVPVAALRPAAGTAPSLFFRLFPGKGNAPGVPLPTVSGLFPIPAPFSQGFGIKEFFRLLPSPRPLCILFSAGEIRCETRFFQVPRRPFFWKRGVRREGRQP